VTVLAFIDFLIKHGLGSPGSIARAMAITYRRLRKQEPSTDEKEILRKTFLTRIQARELWGKGREDDSKIQEVLSSSSVTLLDITMFIVLQEHPEILNSPPSYGSAAEMHEKVKRIVEERLDKHAPNWRKRGM